MKHHVINSQGKTLTYIFWSIFFILLLPIVVLPPSFQPSDWTKSILFRIVLTVIISFLAFKFLYKREFSIEIPKWKNPVYLPLIMFSAFLLMVSISTAFSIDPYFSFFGSPVRAGGLLNLIFFFLFSLFLAIFIKDEEYWHRLIKANFIAGAIASLVAFIQYFGLIKNVFIEWEGGGPPSFLGNSTFLAIYMIFLAFSALYYFIHSENRKQKIFYICLFLLFIFTIIISGSRATYLGLLAAFAFYFLLLPTKYIALHKEQFTWFDLKKFKVIKLVTIIVILLGVLVLLYVNMNPSLPGFISNNDKISHVVKNRLSIPIVLKDITGARLSAWKITFEAIKERPLFGWGPENSYIGFEKHYDPTLPPGLQKLWWDRPHDIFLEIWQNSGIFALILYIGFWITLFWQLQKLKKQNEDKKATFASHGIQAMIIAYLIAISFQFDGFTTYLISFFFIGYSFYLISSYQKSEKIILSPPLRFTGFIKYVSIALILLVMLFTWFWNISPLYFHEKISYIQSRSCPKTITYLGSISPEKYGIIRSYASLKYSDMLKQCISVDPQKELAYSKKAIASLKEAIKIQPYFSRSWLFLGSFTNVVAAREDDKESKNALIEEARSYLNKGIELSPKRQEFLIEMEKNYLIVEDYTMMQKIAQDCITIDSSNGSCYWYLGISQIFLGDQINGAKSIVLSKEKGYIAPNIAYKQLAVAYMSQGNWKQSLEAYKLITAPSANLFPSEAASYRATMAFLYSKTGDYEKAGLEALEVFKLQPDNQETVQFLIQLTGMKPNSLELHKYLAYVYKKIESINQYHKELLFIENAYGNLITQSPNSVEYRFSFAQTLKDIEEYEKSTEQLAQITLLFPNSRSKAEEIVRSLGGHYWAIYAIRVGITK